MKRLSPPQHQRVGPKTRTQSARAPGLRLGCVGITVLSLFACEPDAFLGKDTEEHASLSDGGTGSRSEGDRNAGGAPDLTDDDSLVIEDAEPGGASGTPDDPTFIQGHECSVVEPGESHEEPIAVCCDMNAIEDEWRDQAIAEANLARVDAGLAPFQRDAALDQAAMGWAMHWYLHWDPVARAGYPEDYTAPTAVAAACGTTAHILVMTNAQDETRLENDLIDPSFPAEAWQNSRNFEFENPELVRVGIGFYDGLLLGLFDRNEDP